jgi:hypothetical protein
VKTKDLQVICEAVEVMIQLLTSLGVINQNPTIIGKIVPAAKQFAEEIMLDSSYDRVAASRRSAANFSFPNDGALPRSRYGHFQMAAFTRKPLRRKAPPFRFRPAAVCRAAATEQFSPAKKTCSYPQLVTILTNKGN